MTLKKKDFQKLVNVIKEFQSRLPCGESSAELRDSLNLSLLHLHKYYKRARIRCHNGGNTLEGSISLTSSLTGAASPVSPHIAPVDRFDWRWLNLDVEKLSASFGHGEKTNFVPEIFYVIKDCDIDQLKKIVEEDEDATNELDAIGRTTAMYTTNGGTSSYLDCLRFLISKGVDVQHQSNDGFTCLHIACFFGYQDFIEPLLQAKANINTQDSEGRTAIHFAAAYCTHEMLQMLIINGADPTIRDNEGLSALMWACHFDQLENLQLLLAVQEKSNPSPEARFQSVDDLGRTILHWAVTRTSNIHCMKFLLNAETAQLCDDEGKTIFLFAAEHGCLSACEDLLNLCSDDILEDVDNSGRTALHLATMGGHGEVVDFLLSQGAVAEMEDKQGASPLDFIASRKLSYCSLVFTSYQKYRERMANMHAKLAQTDKVMEENMKNGIGKSKVIDNARDDKESGEGNQNAKFEQVMQNGDEGVLKETCNSLDAENKSLRFDCQDAVGFEIEADIEDEAVFDVPEDELGNNATIDTGNQDLARDPAVEPERAIVLEPVQDPVEVRDRTIDDGTSKLKSKGPRKCDTKSKKPGKEASKKFGNQEDEVSGGRGDEELIGEGGDDRDIKELEVKKELAPIDELENVEISEDDSYDFKEVSIEMEDQKIVLVAHHEGDEGFDIDYGDGINDLEFQDEDNPVSSEGGKELSDTGELTDALKVDPGPDRDLFETSRLSPRIESVTGLIETNTVPANHSVSVNLSVSSLRSDSDDEDAALNLRGRPSKLDSKIPMQIFDERPMNQLEYRDPFSKAKSLPQFDDATSQLKRGEDTRPKTGHSNRKDRKDTQKSKQSSQKGKQIPGALSPPRLSLGALEPMKPLQPIIPPQGFQGSRSGSQGYFPGNSYESMVSTSPRSPLERSNALSSPVESPRSKGSPLPSPRAGLDSREHVKLSHIPRPSSPSNRDKNLPIPGGNHFSPRPPLGR